MLLNLKITQKSLTLLHFSPLRYENQPYNKKKKKINIFAKQGDIFSDFQTL